MAPTFSINLAKVLATTDSEPGLALHSVLLFFSFTITTLMLVIGLHVVING